MTPAPQSYLDVVLSKAKGPFATLPEGPGLYTFLNPYTYRVHRARPERLGRFHGIFIDGQALVGLLDLLPGVEMSRASFDMTSLARVVLRDAAARSLPTYLLGARPAEIEQAVPHLVQAFPGLEITGYRDGYFRAPEERREALESIVAMEPEVVIVGMGAPLQEEVLLELWELGWRGLGFTCGGFLHQTATAVEYYPELIDRLHLRWAYRLLDEPRLIPRVARHYPAFLFDFLKDLRRLRRAGRP